MNPDEEKFSKSVIFRFVGCLRPYLRLVVGAALMGVGKFTLPLAFPLAFKYVIDVLLTSPPKFDGVMRTDRRLVRRPFTGWPVMPRRLPTNSRR